MDEDNPLLKLRWRRTVAFECPRCGHLTTRISRECPDCGSEVRWPAPPPEPATSLERLRRAVSVVPLLVGIGASAVLAAWEVAGRTELEP